MRFPLQHKHREVRDKPDPEAAYYYVFEFGARTGICRRHSTKPTALGNRPPEDCTGYSVIVLRFYLQRHIARDPPQTLPDISPNRHSPPCPHVRYWGERNLRELHDRFWFRLKPLLRSFPRESGCIDDVKPCWSMCPAAQYPSARSPAADRVRSGQRNHQPFQPLRTSEA